jgi:ribonuclease VapC
MIIDTSAIIAILQVEEDYRELGKAIIDCAGSRKISSASYLEASIIVDRNASSDVAAQLDVLIEQMEIKIVPFTAAQSRIARTAYRQYGKGSGHPAQLNFGDCFAYALAKDSGEALLFKGSDFAQTDVVAALP